MLFNTKTKTKTKKTHTEKTRMLGRKVVSGSCIITGYISFLLEGFLFFFWPALNHMILVDFFNVYMFPGLFSILLIQKLDETEDHKMCSPKLDK